MAKKKITKKPVSGTTIKNCHFEGVHWDASAVEAVDMIAEGLLTNAQALGTLAKVLNSQNINIECMVNVEDNS